MKRNMIFFLLTALGFIFVYLCHRRNPCEKLTLAGSGLLLLLTRMARNLKRTILRNSLVSFFGVLLTNQLCNKLWQNAPSSMEIRP